MTTYLFFDTETNGLPARYDASITDSDNWPQILQLAWVLASESGEEITRGNYLIRPDNVFRLDDAAASIHGLTLDKLATGQLIDSVMARFANDVTRADALVAHNLDFDRAITQAELFRLGWTKSIKDMNVLVQICTMKRATNYCATPGGRRGYKWPNLAQLHHKLFNEGFDGAHDAMNDVQAMMRCFWRLKELGVIP